MVLGFKQFINKVPTHFVEKILALHYPELREAGFIPKIHTIREGDRWKKGNSIQMAVGVRTKHYKQFNKGIPELSECISTQKINIVWGKSTLGKHVQVFIDSVNVTSINAIIDTLVINDGFANRKDFFNYFNEDFEGQIVQWTDFKY